MTVSLREPFRWPVRVYYEDTDAGGIVYYANYLRFLERARTEWLCSMGSAPDALEREHNAVFVVHRLEIEFAHPARLGELLDVTLALDECGRSRLVATQDVLRNGTCLAHARLTLACVDRRSWRPARIPAALAVKLRERPQA